MEQRLSEEQTGTSTRQIPCILWNPKFHYSIYNGGPPPLACTEPEKSSPCSHPTSWKSILILSSYLGLRLPSGFFPWGLLTEATYASLLSPIRVTYPAHLILLDLTTRTIFGGQYRSLSSSLRSLLHSPVTSSSIGPNILLSTALDRAFMAI